MGRDRRSKEREKQGGKGRAGRVIGKVGKDELGGEKDR